MEINTVLIVDDDEAVLDTLSKVVKSNDFEAVTAQSGEEALKLMETNQYCIVLLDINMHGISGFDVLEAMRKQGNHTPVIIISARQEDWDTIYGLTAGADDYITKPFNPVTLGAKIKAVIRRTNCEKKAEPVTSAGPFTFNNSTLRFFKNDTEIFLTGKENALMKLFLDNQNRIFSKEMIYDMVWGDVFVDENAVMVYINRLRRKIEDDPENPQYIRNVRGIGYRFVI